jgi:hypothetical protein
MSLRSLLKRLLPPELDFEAQVQDALPRYEARSRVDLLEQLRGCSYLHMAGRKPGSPDMEASEVVQRLLGANTPEHFQALVDDWKSVLNALRQAEFATGHRGRPMLLDYDLHLTCIVRVLAQRA